MNPKDGNSGRAVTPATPDEVIEADIADPGKVAKSKAEQVKAEEGKFGQTPVKPHKPGTVEAKETHWIEVELVDEEGEPIPSERFEVTLPDGSVASGTLGQDGVGRVDGIPDPGSCKINFPHLDRSAWEPA
jgi:type VI secretion system secreted protein VgrG